jgi:hypothetical protein
MRYNREKLLNDYFLVSSKDVNPDGFL